MKKNLKTVKTGIILGLVLISMFAVFIPNASAGIIKVVPKIYVNFSQQKDNVIPNSGAIVIPLHITFVLTGIGASTVAANSLLKDSPVSIQLKVESKPDWVQASIINPAISTKLTDTEAKESQLSITVTEKAPVFQQGSVRISATSKQLPGLLYTIAQDVEYYDIPFQIGYWPVVSYVEPKGTSYTIGPMDTAGVDIILTNLGNGPTHVSIEPVGIPKDWSVSIASSADLASAVSQNSEGTTKTVRLNIKPPYGFGFHNEQQSIQIKFTPQLLGNTQGSALVGPTETITITVQSIGFSTGTGYEIPSIVIVLIVIALIVYLYMRRKK